MIRVTAVIKMKEPYIGKYSDYRLTAIFPFLRLSVQTKRIVNKNPLWLIGTDPVRISVYSFTHPEVPMLIHQLSLIIKSHTKK